MKICQIILLCLLVAAFFRALRTDFHGSEAKKPDGFTGAVMTVVITFLLALCYWKAGAFSMLFG